MNNVIEWLRPIWQPHQGQAEFLLNRAKTKVLACGRRWGKTEACAAASVDAMRSSAPTRHLLIAPTLDQARILFERVLDLCGRAVEAGLSFGHDVVEKITSLKFSPYPQFALGPHRLTARSGHIARALRGNEATHVIVDEAAFVPEELITDIVSPMLATNDGQLTLISTPRGLNHFWRFFQLGVQGKHGVWSRSAPSGDSPHVSRDFLERQRQLISERSFATEYEALFIEVAGAVFRKESVEGCLREKVEAPPGDICIGIDWGRLQDYTTVAILQGSQRNCALLSCFRLPQSSWPDQLARIEHLLQSYPRARVVVDATGGGDVLAADLKRSIRNAVYEFRFTSDSKAKLVEGLALAFDHGWIQMQPNTELLEELQAFEQAPTNTGRASYNARAGYHDDLVIALALGVYGLPSDSGGSIITGAPRTFTN